MPCFIAVPEQAILSVFSPKMMDRAEAMVDRELPVEVLGLRFIRVVIPETGERYYLNRNHCQLREAREDEYPDHPQTTISV